MTAQTRWECKLNFQAETPKEIYEREMQDSLNLRAVTTVEISGECIPTIPVGTEFTIFAIGKIHSSVASGLPINQIWNDEYSLLEVV